MDPKQSVIKGLPCTWFSQLKMSENILIGHKTPSPPKKEH